ncbi:LysR family transcriptional regulator [Catellatospora sp. TT07R-123]|uniref:LysR family transcriptional regulator n=1 Tax=Catellatospora sp. TT07R-123 TaxID=2733863 RepID=UPI001BB32AD8|nr:LysR family transcriptional regulator [Catellatospora sp. TT07R-123]
MEIRDIEIFLTLAEELHFGRTAQRLYVSQARISQAVKQQERRVGGELFDRANRRQIQLTPLGRQLYDDLRPVYAGLRAGLARAQLAARGIDHVLRVGLLPVNRYDMRRFWESFQADHPRWKLRFQFAPFVDPFAGLRAGEIDVLVAWLPVEEPDLTVGPVILSEPRVLAVAVGHELAPRSSIPLEAAADFQHPQVVSPDYWFDGYAPPHTRTGRVIERGPVVRNNDEVLTMVSVGEVVALYPAHVSRYLVRPDLAYIPVRDLEELRYALVWRTESENEPIRALADTVRTLGVLRPHE